MTEYSFLLEIRHIYEIKSFSSEFSERQSEVRVCGLRQI